LLYIKKAGNIHVHASELTLKIIFLFQNECLPLQAQRENQPLIITITMKEGIHPASYRPVAFRDLSNGDTFITRSTVATKETVEIDGVTYPLVKLEISSSSHPFYTGKQKLVDTAGRVDKFMNRYQKHLENKKK